MLDPMETIEYDLQEANAEVSRLANEVAELEDEIETVIVYWRNVERRYRKRLAEALWQNLKLRGVIKCSKK